jgi:hypothetical protein
MIRCVFVEEIENKLRRENPQKTVQLTQMALLSGLDTRTLTKIRNSKNYGRPFCEEKNFVKEFTPGAAILDAWSSTPPYVNEQTGKPNSLPVSGKSPSFESLFEVTGRARGITYRSLLSRLCESGAVLLNEERNEVRLIAKSYLPSDSGDKLGAIEMGFSAVGSMLDTVTRNITALESGEDRFYQRGAWTHRLNPAKKGELRSLLRQVLESTDDQARTIIENIEDKTTNLEQVTAGISCFYFEQPRS